MQDLTELVNLIQRTKFKTNGLLEVIIEPNTQMGQLYQAIVKKQIQTDEDALALLPELGEDPAKLATVKSKLKDRLRDSVFLLGYKESGYGDRQAAFFECTKKWASAMILISKNVRHSSIQQLETLLRRAVHFEFTELTLDILRILRLHFGIVVGDEKKFFDYEEMLGNYERIWIVERQVESLYANLVIRFVNSKSDREGIEEKAASYYETIEPFLAEFSSFKVHMFGRLIGIIVHDSRNDFVTMAQACEAAIAFFEKKPYQSGLSLQVFYNHLITAYLHTREFSKVKDNLAQVSSWWEEGSYNWFKLQELYFFTAMHDQQYRSAYDIYRTVQENTQFEQLPAPVTEMWKILEAYIFFLIQIGKIGPEPELQHQAKFKVNRFLNEVPVFSKDKRGMNISLLVLQFLFALADGKQDLCEDRVEALNKYRTRYLSDEDSLRSNLFIKMLACIPQGGFTLPRVLEKTKKLSQTLLHTPPETVNQNYEVEIIPYDHLWPLALACLPKLNKN